MINHEIWGNCVFLDKPIQSLMNYTGTDKSMNSHGSILRIVSIWYIVPILSFLSFHCLMFRAKSPSSLYHLYSIHHLFLENLCRFPSNHDPSVPSVPTCLTGRGARDHAFDHRLPRRGILQEAGTVRWRLGHGKPAMNQWFFGIPGVSHRKLGQNGKHKKLEVEHGKPKRTTILLRGWLLPIQYQYQPLGAPVPIEVLPRTHWLCAKC